MSAAEWTRLAWLALGVGIIVGFGMGIAVCAVTS